MKLEIKSEIPANINIKLRVIIKNESLNIAGHFLTFIKYIVGGIAPTTIKNIATIKLLHISLIVGIFTTIYPPFNLLNC